MSIANTALELRMLQLQRISA